MRSDDVEAARRESRQMRRWKTSEPCDEVVEMVRGTVDGEDGIGTIWSRRKKEEEGMIETMASALEVSRVRGS